MIRAMKSESKLRKQFKTKDKTKENAYNSTIGKKGPH